MHKRYTILGFLTMIALVLVMSACGGSSQPAGQVLLNSSNAMKQLKAVHVDMNMTMGINMSGMMSSTSGSTSSNTTNITLKGGGDEVLPDQSSMKFTTGIGTTNSIVLAEITKGNSIYIQNTKGQWYVLDKSKLLGRGSSIFSNASMPDFNKLLQIAEKNAKVTDRGNETLNGVSLRHISVALDKTGFENLLKSIGQMNNVTSATQQSLDNVFNSMKGLNASMDFWIDESTSYLHRMEMKMNFNMDMSSFVTPTQGTTKGTSGISLSMDMRMDLSRFNDSSIQITAPANAIPTDNPGVIFGING